MFMRRHPPHHLSPARAKHPAGQNPEARLGRPSHHSNAPIKLESQSILTKIVALMPSKESFGKSFSGLELITGFVCKLRALKSIMTILRQHR
jgi:hypothetical protein